MIDRIQMALIGLYVTGWLLDWAYWITVGWSWSASGDNSHALPAIFGWAPAAFWPLHALSELWQWVLT
jgi:hypothetical protein